MRTRPASQAVRSNWKLARSTTPFKGKHDPAAGAQNVKTFIADSAVLGMIGPFNSSVAKSEIPLTNDAGLVQISPSNTTDGLMVGDDAKKLRTAHPDTNSYFRVCTKDSRQGTALAQFAQKLGYKKVFIIDDNETSVARGGPGKLD